MCCHHVRSSRLVSSCQGAVQLSITGLVVSLWADLSFPHCSARALYHRFSVSMLGVCPTGKPPLLQGRLSGRGPLYGSADALLLLLLPGRCPCRKGAGPPYLDNRRAPSIISAAQGAPLPFPVARSCSALDPTLSTGLRRPARTLRYFSSMGAPLLFSRSEFLLGPGPGPLHRSLPPRMGRTPYSASTPAAGSAESGRPRSQLTKNGFLLTAVLTHGPAAGRGSGPPPTQASRLGPSGVRTLGSGSRAGYRSRDVGLPVSSRRQGWIPTYLPRAQPPSGTDLRSRWAKGVSNFQRINYRPLRSRALKRAPS
ncbi:hypothetical protein NDU88_006147 [Pleurodeles waltl]|uniref:Uncharacterized protein n=1 Tax=Pleurodeles waltl TaxID=8319 RepID=A0AAV7TXG0_PLEWA|nr:hypothetical protein NDU88_006147 [Pleurodeles waltl]